MDSNTIALGGIGGYLGFIVTRRATLRATKFENTSEIGRRVTTTRGLFDAHLIGGYATIGL